MITRNNLLIPFRDLSLSAYSYQNLDSEDDPEVLALVLPGFLDTKDYPHMYRLCEKLAEHGLMAASFDPSGTWQSSGEVTDYTISNYLENIETVALFFKSTFTSLKKLVLIGHSLGGMMALEFSIKYPANAAVAIMSPSGFVRPDNYDKRVTQWKANGFNESRRDIPGTPEVYQYFKLPFSFVEDALEYELSRNINEIKVPVLMIAGEKDERIPADSVQNLFKLAPEPKQFAQVKDVGHDYRKFDEDTDKVNEVIIKYLKNLKLAE